MSFTLHEYLTYHSYIAGLYKNKMPKDLVISDSTYMRLLKSGKIQIFNIPREHKNREMCLVAVTRNGSALRDVPEEFKWDREMCLAAVTSNGSALDRVPYKLRDREMCLTAVTSNGSALDRVPEELRDREMCLTAVSNNITAIDSVPPNLRDEIRAAVMRKRVYV